MKTFKRFLVTVSLLLLFIGCSKGSNSEPLIPEPEPANPTLRVIPDQLSLQGVNSGDVTFYSTHSWTASSSKDWCSCSPGSGSNGSTKVQIFVASNTTGSSRDAEVTFNAQGKTTTLKITQASSSVANYVPEGYSLAWSDEFSEAPLPDTKKWYYETGKSGWGNNELQNYVAATSGSDTCALVKDGILKIIAKKKGSDVLSIRMNTSESWTYGYFEARLKLPAGKGTWPAFWMLPKDFKNWPDDGEIDIMEEVGYDPNTVLSTIHCKAYNHSIGTQRSGSKFVSTAQTDFHVYAVEWTTDYIKGFVDGTCYFTFMNDQNNNKNTWPFNVPFYLKLNLAWGGDWGGAQGIDESKLPATYEIDYVRVYQKK